MDWPRGQAPSGETAAERQEPTVYVRFRATDGAATTATKLTAEEAKAAMALFDTDLRDKRRKYWKKQGGRVRSKS